MRPDALFLRFDDRHEAIAVLSAIGIRPMTDADGIAFLPCSGAVARDGMVGESHYMIEVVSGEGIICRPSGETASFEGEQVALTEPLSGYHIRLLWTGEPPPQLLSHIVAPGSAAAVFSG